MGEYRQLSDLPPSWSYGVTEDGRVFFIDEQKQYTTWLHPITREPFQSGFICDPELPTGWELDTDREGKVFFIDHLQCVNTYQPPPIQAPLVNNSESNNVGESNNDGETNAPKSAFQRTSSKKKFGFLKASEKAPVVQRDYTSEAVLKGWLYKQDEALLKLIRQWKKRWCVLSNGTLFCYEGESEIQQVTSFSLHGCRVTPRVKDDSASHKFVFKIELPDGRKSFYFACDSDVDMDKWVNLLSEFAGLTPEDMPQSANVQPHPNQKFPAVTGVVSNPGEDPVGWQTRDHYNYDGQYSAVDVDGQAPLKPPRQNMQQYVEPEMNRGGEGSGRETAPQMRNTAVNVNSPARRSVYPYQQRDNGLVDNRSHQNRVMPLNTFENDIDATSTPVQAPMRIEYPRGSAAVSGNPEDVYAKVVKKNRPADRAIPNQRSGNDPAFLYDRQVSSFGGGSRPENGQGAQGASNSPYQQDQVVVGRKPGEELARRDYNFNVPGKKLEMNGRDFSSADPFSLSDVGPPGSFRTYQQRVYNGGERHLDGTPMFGDPRQGKRSPAAPAVQDVYGGAPQSKTPFSQQNLGRPKDESQMQQLADGSFFRYPSVHSSSQLHSSGALDPRQQSGRALLDQRPQQGGEFFLPPRDYRGSQISNAFDVSNVAYQGTHALSDNQNARNRSSDARSVSRLSNADSVDRLGVPNVDAIYRRSVDLVNQLNGSNTGSVNRLDVPYEFLVRPSSQASNRTSDLKGNGQPASQQSSYADLKGTRGLSQRDIVNGTSKSFVEPSPANGGTPRSYIGLTSASPPGTRQPSDYQPRLLAPASPQQAYQPMPSRGFEAIKEDPDMPDIEFQPSKTLEQLKKHLSGHVRLRLSISTGDLVGKSHEELVLLLIQLRRSHTQLEEMRRWVQERLDGVLRPSAGTGAHRMGSNSTEPELSQMYIAELQNQHGELCKQIEITQPMINLLDNMVTMGSLYGANNLLYTSQYKKGQLPADQPVPANKMLEFSRRHQEELLASRQNQSQHQLTDVEADMEERQQRLYQLDRLVQERSFNVTSLQDDKAVLERNLDEVCRLEDYERDAVARSRLGQRRNILEQELSRVRQQLAEASKLLEEATAENARVEQDVIMLRNKVYGLPHSTSSPALANGNGSAQAVVRMEQELEQVKTMMKGLSTQGFALSETIQSFKPLSPAGMNAQPPSGSTTGTYLETDLDQPLTRDIAVRAQPARPIGGSQRFKSSPEIATATDGSNPTTRAVQPAADQSRSEKRLDSAQNVRHQQSSVRYRPQDSGQAMLSGGHYPPFRATTSRPVQSYSRSRPVEIVAGANLQKATREPSARQEPFVRLPVTTSAVPPPDPTMNYYDPRNVRKSVRDVKSKDMAGRLEDDGREPELRRTKSMPRVASDRGDRQYNGDQSRGTAEPSNAVQRLFQPYVSSGNIPAEMPLYTSSGKYRTGASENYSAVRPYDTTAGSVERMSENSEDRDQRGSFQRWRNMTVSSSHPAAMERRKSGWNDVAEKSRSFDNLVKGEQSRRMEFDDETIDRELQRPEQVLIPERYDLDDVEEEQPLTEEEHQLKLVKSEKYRKMLAAHSLQEFSEAELSLSGGPLHAQVDNEMKRREKLLDVRQQLAQEVTQKSKVAAMRRKSNPNIPEGFSAMIADRSTRNNDQYTPDIIGYLPVSS